jgi:transposase
LKQARTQTDLAATLAMNAAKRRLFESFEEDELRQKGFSKDHKSAETQVLLALLVTREGLPVGYRLYPGAQWEGDTLRQAVADAREICSVRRIVLVADAGLFNKKNLDMLPDFGG